jgi:hypothetical protein
MNVLMEFQASNGIFSLGPHPAAWLRRAAANRRGQHAHAGKHPQASDIRIMHFHGDG